MYATRSLWERDVERLLSDLNDTALEVIMAHGTRTTSIDVELELWAVLNETFAREGGGRGDTVLAALADAAYQVALRSGTGGSFLEVELTLWKAFRRIGRQPRYRSFFPPAAPAWRQAALVS